MNTSSVLVFRNIVLWLKSWYLAEKRIFPPEHCRGGICASQPKKWKHLINVNKSCYFVLILDSHSKRLLLSLLSYPDVNTIWKLTALSCDIKSCWKQQLTCKYGLSSNPGILDYWDFIFDCEYRLRARILKDFQLTAWLKVLFQVFQVCR